ncbi:PQQ-dependent sugar dehydrogenase [Hymenobacter psychrotolerans]|uniref:Glucose/arabinose dehydrogenase, beta-propeller fold n=1 Tax=Hymenobacter psychrotolerans DSM 18569 TaxID=1121959 RepID=A0A1M6VZ21_9BACT|nr:PQQ-dependent sugar dehydrogenase [Hymenobacter psychrotolerans]SHK86683.1 Glucose/arabinose dehydrogenase, beta-propeller fold [Hymenobacter psychrotolerans DSM 18569]
MTNTTSLLLATALLAGFSATAQNVPPEATPFQMQGNIYLPKKLPATPERIASLKAPAGFTVSAYAEGLDMPRMLALAPNGDLYVSNRVKGTVILLRDANKDGKVELTKQVAQKPHLHGLALKDGKLYMAAVRELYVADVQADGSLSEPKLLYKDLPDAGQHANRTLQFGPDGKLYLSVGSTCNACDEDNPENATLLQVNTDGSGRTVYATGLRNTIGFDWHPTTKALFGMDHGIDWLGDEDQQEELNQLKQGGHYGWPSIIADGKPYPANKPKSGESYEQFDAKAVRPLLLYKAHSAPLGLVFNRSKQLPAEYQNTAFVTMHGSWNRAQPSGYKIVRVRFNEQGQPQQFEDFVTGWLVENDKSEFGRPCAIVQAPDGSLLVSDDDNGVIYRVAYTGGGKAVKKEKKRG